MISFHDLIFMISYASSAYIMHLGLCCFSETACNVSFCCDVWLVTQVVHSC